MKIPTRVRVGRKWYEVKRERFKPEYKRGTWTWQAQGNGTIRVQPSKPMKQQHETYLHELTHAILWKMGCKELCASEPFVTVFAHNLNNALHSAEFE